MARDVKLVLTIYTSECGGGAKDSDFEWGDSNKQKEKRISVFDWESSKLDIIGFYLICCPLYLLHVTAICNTKQKRSSLFLLSRLETNYKKNGHQSLLTNLDG